MSHVAMSSLVNLCLLVCVCEHLVGSTTLPRRTMRLSHNGEESEHHGDRVIDTAHYEEDRSDEHNLSGDLFPNSALRVRSNKGNRRNTGSIGPGHLTALDGGENSMGQRPNCPLDDETFYRTFEDIADGYKGDAELDNKGRKCECSQGKYVVCNCSNLRLQNVPQKLPNSMQGLDLSHNFIENFETQSNFKNYPNLKYLSLSHNHIRTLYGAPFKGLKELRVLDLLSNSLEMKSNSYPADAFSELSSLVALRLSNNTKIYHRTQGWSYPDIALSELTSLRVLAIDGLTNKTFGEGFEKMNSLETLIVVGFYNGYCELEGLAPDALKPFGKLKMLNLTDCFLHGKSIDNRTFSPLKNLRTLDLSWNEHISMYNLARILQGLRYSDLRQLVLDHVETRFSPGIRIHSYYMDNIPRNLSCLVVSGNSINRIDPDVISRLPKGLRYLDVSANKFVFGSYLKNLSLLENLETLEANGPSFSFQIPKRFPQSPPSPPKRAMQMEQVLQWHSAIDERLPLLEKNTGTGMLTVNLPPKLKRLSMAHAGLNYKLSNLSFGLNNSLEELLLSGNLFPVADGSLFGLNELKILDMSSCQISDVSKTFFKYFPKLEKLNLFGNYLGQSNPLEPLFQSLYNLKSLDLSFNVIDHLKNNTLKGLSNLVTLDLSRNILYIFEANISHMKHLKIINLNATSVHKLLSKTRKDLDTLNDVLVHMYGAPLRCLCVNQDFLGWMTRSPAIARYYSYICIFDDASAKVLDWRDFLDTVDDIAAECRHPYGLFFAVLGGTVLFLVLTIVSITYRFRWRLRYLYYGIHLWATKTSCEVPDRGQFLYDVFLSYSSDDFEFVMDSVIPELQSRGLKVCVHSRDFLAGENIITNIIRSVKQSRRTLVILTNNLLDSKWCRCEFQMAKEEAVVTGRNVLIFLIVEEIPTSKIGLELLNHIQQNTFVPYHRRQEDDGRRENDRKMIWDKLVSDINS